MKGRGVLVSHATFLLSICIGKSNATATSGASPDVAHRSLSEILKGLLGL